MFDLSGSTELQGITAYDLLLYGFIVWVLVTQVWFPLRKQHADRVLKADRMETRLSEAERKLDDKVHKEDFANLERRVSHDISILERMEKKLDDFINDVRLTHQAFESRVTRLETKKEISNER